MPPSPSGPRPAWYAATPGRWRDWLTVLHLPYTAWHLSFVLVGAGLAAHVRTGRLVATLLAFALAVGLAAHTFDELRGRPLGTAIPGPVLATVGGAALAGAVAFGIVGIGRVGWGLGAFIAVGAALVVAYNFELWGGRLHNDATFALAWGAFPVLTAYYAQTSTVRLSSVAAAAWAFGLSRAQRALSSEARGLRRRTASVTGARVADDGTRHDISRASLLLPLERALAALSWSTCALGVGLVLAHTGS